MNSNTNNKSATPTDKEMLANDLKLLKGARLLQVVKTHTHAEIIAKVKANHPRCILPESNLSTRVGRACALEGRRQGRSNNEIKQELTNARRVNGVLDRQSVYLSSKISAGLKPRNTARDEGDADEDLLAGVEEKGSEVSNGSLGSDESNEDPLRDLEEMGRLVLAGTL